MYLTPYLSCKFLQSSKVLTFFSYARWVLHVQSLWKRWSAVTASSKCWSRTFGMKSSIFKVFLPLRVSASLLNFALISVWVALMLATSLASSVFVASTILPVESDNLEIVAYISLLRPCMIFWTSSSFFDVPERPLIWDFMIFLNISLTNVFFCFFGFFSFLTHLRVILFSALIF